MRMTLRSFALFATLILLFLFTTARADTPADPPPAREIKVTARKFEFQPHTITAHTGERIRLVITSEDVDHGFALKAFGVNEKLPAHQTRTVEFAPDRAGKFTFACSVFCGDGHEDMTGELIVTDGQSPDAGVHVTFDDSAPGVAYVEVNGQRIRIDTQAKTVARVDTPETPSTAQVKEPPMVAVKERDSSKIYEPYDYRADAETGAPPQPEFLLHAPLCRACSPD